MAGTVHTEAYKKLLRALVEARCAAGLSQAQLAKMLGKPASFVGKYELGERRLDVIEFMVVLKVLRRDIGDLSEFGQVDLPDHL
ncbi:helix-turn-helix domain-containing protein [Roseinatronobacter monicus]|uniref:Helix-turn-helix protein n=1 Tax=Roseinatronobacter monicus TaxID=393481 RepID=A0A543KEX5_9RHOB|nr:helix-turn-helix transcriptional regulator [Roseinatronobacter monicus]TQM93621.1 helix-turn-helix protein [Roseinatronobacter monicus]